MLWEQRTDGRVSVEFPQTEHHPDGEPVLTVVVYRGRDGRQRIDLDPGEVGRQELHGLAAMIGRALREVGRII